MLISILRTVVPVLWGNFIFWLLALMPILEPLREQLLAYGDLAVPVVGAVIVGAWYALWRKLEPNLPDWLTRILLGSAKSPVYAPTVRLGIDQETIDRALGSIQQTRDGEPIPGTTLDLGAVESLPHEADTTREM